MVYAVHARAFYHFADRSFAFAHFLLPPCHACLIPALLHYFWILILLHALLLSAFRTHYSADSSFLILRIDWWRTLPVGGLHGFVVVFTILFTLLLVVLLNLFGVVVDCW